MYYFFANGSVYSQFRRMICLAGKRQFLSISWIIWEKRNIYICAMKG